MTSIFVSYRREDSCGRTDRLYDQLVRYFGQDQVFKDVDPIPHDRDLRKVLTKRVAACDVLLAVIGDRWLSVVGQGGARRLDDPGDFVRIEIEAALSRKILVIPVLVGDAPVPRADELPESLRGLSFRYGLVVRPDPDFHRDMDSLIRGIEDAVDAPRQPLPSLWSQTTSVMDRLIRGIEHGVSALRQRPAPRDPETQKLKVDRIPDLITTKTAAIPHKLIPAGDDLHSLTQSEVSCETGVEGGSMSRVFISHSTKDRDFVEGILVPAIHGFGLETWYSKNDIKATDRWERSILNGLESSDWFLIVMSPNSAESEWVRDELHWAMGNRPHGRIVPVMIEGCNPYDFHIRLPRLQFVDYSQDRERALAQLKTIWVK